MTAPAKVVAKVEPRPTTALERARRGLPLVEHAAPNDDQTIDVRAWARQVVAVALRVEGVDAATLTPAQPEE